MQNQPLISIVLPIFNVELFLNEAIDSLLSQTYENIEIVAINDGSTDNSLQILTDYNNPKIKIIDKPNSGYGASVNRGIQESTGEYIYILEPDDYIEDKTLSILVSHIDNDVDIIRPNSFYLLRGNQREYFAAYENKNSTEKSFFIREGYNQASGIWVSLYKKSFLISNNIKLLETPGASFQDEHFFTITSLLARKVKMINGTFYYYRQHANQSVNKTIHWNIIPHMCNLTLQELYARKIFDDYKDCIFHRFIAVSQWHYERIADEVKSKFVKEIRLIINELLSQGASDKLIFYQHQKDFYSNIINSKPKPKPNSHINNLPLFKKVVYYYLYDREGFKYRVNNKLKNKPFLFKLAKFFSKFF